MLHLDYEKRATFQLNFISIQTLVTINSKNTTGKIGRLLIQSARKFIVELLLASLVISSTRLNNSFCFIRRGWVDVSGDELGSGNFTRFSRGCNRLRIFHQVKLKIPKHSAIGFIWIKYLHPTIFLMKSLKQTANRVFIECGEKFSPLHSLAFTWFSQSLCFHLAPCHSRSGEST